MRRIATFITLTFIMLGGAGYVIAQTGGPGYRPKTGSNPRNNPTTTVPSVPVPYNPPTYNPNTPSTPSTTQRQQVQAQLDQNRAQQQQLKRQMQQLKDQERILRDQLKAIDNAQNGYYENENYAAKEHHDNGKHKGWYKNGKAKGQERDDD